MRKIWKLLPVAAMITGLNGIAVAQTHLIDQVSNDASSSIARFGLNAGLAQSFQQSSTNISGAALWMSALASAPSGTVQISLWDGLPTASGHQLAQGSAFGQSGALAEVYWNPVSIQANTTYFLVFESSSTLFIGGSEGNPYSNGQAYVNGYTQYSTLDFTFRTFTDTTFVAAAPVPEPETYAMLLGGLGLLGYMTKRRKRNA
ncbi:PEP-CTERM sorting domain-containing protein [Duganella aceris]|nr:PEP-CTERM sorting domain-containing protein [Duganella aceris]